MKEILESEIATALPSMLREVDRESIAIRSGGRPVAYLVSPREFETTREARAKQAIEAMEALQTEVATNIEQCGLSMDELMRDVDRKAR
jgi:PHD/YefM family antitoxin component YafN of YafNO toxin-antitoxin module